MFTGVLKQSQWPQKPNWVYLSVDTDVAKYLITLWNKFDQPLGWAFPLNGPHITIIAGEKETTPVNIEPLISLFGKEFNFQFEENFEVLTNGRAFWIECSVLQGDALRRLVGLTPKKFKYHLTLGNIKGR